MIDPPPSHVAIFESARPTLRNRSYRMLGSWADADDVVQSTWERWDRVERSGIREPHAWLTTVSSRLALDQLRRRKRDQQHYVGPWLPEPLVSDLAPASTGNPEAAAELADSLSLGFLIMLEALNPDERAAFLMADVFSEPYTVIAERLDRTVESCRQLASRARRKVADHDRHERSSVDVAQSVVATFLGALVIGDEDAALGCLHADVVLTSDGGAARRAARRPVIGADRVGRFLANLAKRVDPTWTVAVADVGGLPGTVFASPEGVEMVMAFTVAGGRVVEIFSILNPDKLVNVAT